jgi:hypothetical protein
MKDERINGTRVKCYALKEGTPDRFTVVYPDEPDSTIDSRFRACVGLTGHGSALMGRHLGKRIPFAELPESLKQTVEMDTAVCECEEGSLTS